MHELQELLREQRVLVSEIKAASHRMRQAAAGTSIKKGQTVQRMLLLTMAESLVAAHKAAKIDDGYTLDLIEDAMRHVGERLSAECSDGRTFSRKRLGPV